MRKVFILIFLAATFYFSCSTKKSNQIESLANAEWLQGTWQGMTRSGLQFFETWNKVNDTLYRNLNFHFDNGKDSVVGGKSELYLKDGKVFYGNGEPGRNQRIWNATTFENGNFIFENDSIASAKKISFQLEEKIKWHATIYGQKDTIQYYLIKR